MTETALFGSTILALAVCATAHAAILYGLAWRRPRWRVPVALLFAPVAPFWAWQEKMWVRAAFWVLGAVAYLIARLLQA